MENARAACTSRLGSSRSHALRRMPFHPMQRNFPGKSAHAVSLDGSGRFLGFSSWWKQKIVDYLLDAPANPCYKQGRLPPAEIHPSRKEPGS